MNNIQKTIDNNNKFFPNSKKTNRGQISPINHNDPARRKRLEGIIKNDAKVQIPDAVKDFAKIKRAVDKAPPIDNSKKVADLKKMIGQGSYKIDYDALADKMLATEF
ncbi:MAG: flagellar biosynthesis anti-sigma factor FlgM [Bacteriovoracaceae bacterium]|nr:flagellar biosynthesis anti-sigma factor FlgM [Bacteriovoracaceae bacterium]